MDVVLPPFFTGTNFFPWIPEDKLGVLTPIQLVGCSIPFPDHIVCSFGCQTISTFTAEEFFLCLFALANISHRTNHPQRSAIYITFDIRPIADIGIGTILEQEAIFLHPNGFLSFDETI